MSDFSYTLDTQLKNQKELVIQNNYGFSPFLICNTYNLGLIKDVDLSIISKSSELKSNQFNITELSNENLSTQLDYFEDSTLLAQITNNNLPNNSLSNPEIRYPFGSLSPEIYIGLPSDLDLETHLIFQKEMFLQELDFYTIFLIFPQKIFKIN